MRNSSIFAPLLCFCLLFASTVVHAASSAPELEKSLSETLDLWRDGRFDLLYERLSHRGRMSKEKFVVRMKEASAKPACCWQKLENFKVLGEKNSEATVYVKIGLEHVGGRIESITREFRLSHDNEAWKMQMGDVAGLAGISSKNGKKH